MRPEEWLGGDHSQPPAVEVVLASYPAGIVEIPVQAGGPRVKWVTTSKKSRLGGLRTLRNQEIDPQQALVDLIGVADARGHELPQRVVRFVDRHAALGEAVHFLDLYSRNGWLHEPSELRAWRANPPLGEVAIVPSLIRAALEQPNEGWKAEALRPGLGAPLWCYVHEAQMLKQSVALYAMIVGDDDDDMPGLRAWCGARSLVYAPQLPATIMEAARNELVARVNPYQQLVSYRFEVERGGAFRQTPHAWTLLGLIYARFSQIISGQQPVRTCEGCGRLYVPKRPNNRYCTPDCGDAQRMRNYRAKRRSERGHN